MNVAERQQQLNEVKVRLDSMTSDFKKEAETSAQRQSEMNTLQQRVADMKSHKESTDQKLQDTEKMVTKLKVPCGLFCS